MQGSKKCLDVIMVEYFTFYDFYWVVNAMNLILKSNESTHIRHSSFLLALQWNLNELVDYLIPSRRNYTTSQESDKVVTKKEEVTSELHLELLCGVGWYYILDIGVVDDNLLHVFRKMFL